MRSSGRRSIKDRCTLTSSSRLSAAGALGDFAVSFSRRVERKPIGSREDPVPAVVG